MKLKLEYSSKDQLFAILSEYISYKDVKFIINQNQIDISFSNSKNKKEKKPVNILAIPKMVAKIKKAIKILKSKNIQASYENIAKYLNMKIGTLNNNIKYYKDRGYSFDIDLKIIRLEYKDHPLYHKMYTVWRGMIQRCHNINHQSYHRYGGRGIFVCDEWRDPDQFFLDMHTEYRDGLTLDRINNDLGYYKENCHWTDRKNQLRNTCRSRKITFQGIPMIIIDILEKLELSKYKNIIRNSNFDEFESWENYLDACGIKYNNKIYCCNQHFFDDNNISSEKLSGLMERYYHYNKDIKKPILQNLGWYMDNCYNFSDNINKIIKGKKIYKKDILEFTFM